MINLSKRTGEERRRQTLCEKRDDNFVRNNSLPNCPVTFVTHERFVFFFFLPSSCVNSLITILIVIIIIMLMMMMILILIIIISNIRVIYYKKKIEALSDTEVR